MDHTLPASPATLEGAANVLALNSGQTIPAAYRSISRYVERCAHLGCTLPAFETGYCCETHRNFATANANTNTSFHYFGCFLDSKYRNTVCCICLYNRLRGLQVGIPVLRQENVFQVLPWEQPDIFSTDRGECNWLFFRSEIPLRYTQIPGTGGLKWKSNAQKRLIVTGVEPQHEQRNVFITSFNLRRSSKVDNQFSVMARNWNLQLFECGGFFLYYLSRTTDVATANPTVVTGSKIHKGDEEEDSDEAPTSSKKSGKRPVQEPKEADKGSRLRQHRVGSSNAGKVRSIKPQAEWSGHLISLSVNNSIFKTNDWLVVPVTTAEFTVLKTAFSVKARSQIKERSTATDVEVELPVPTDVSAEIG